MYFCYFIIITENSKDVLRLKVETPYPSYLSNSMKTMFTHLKFTLNFNENNVNPVERRTLQHDLHENDFIRRVLRKNMAI